MREIDKKLLENEIKFLEYIRKEIWGCHTGTAFEINQRIKELKEEIKK